MNKKAKKRLEVINKKLISLSSRLAFAGPNVSAIWKIGPTTSTVLQTLRFFTASIGHP